MASMASWQSMLDALSSRRFCDPPAVPASKDTCLNENCILSIYENKDVLSAIEAWLDKFEASSQDLLLKNYEKAEIYRQEGNRFYVSGLNEKALKSYNNSVRHYPMIDREQKSIYRAECEKGIAIAYANRSAVFFNKKNWQKCIYDIERAMGYSYPDNLKCKLFKRKAECFLNLCHRRF